MRWKKKKKKNNFSPIYFSSFCEGFYLGIVKLSLSYDKFRDIINDAHWKHKASGNFEKQTPLSYMWLALHVTLAKSLCFKKKKDNPNLNYQHICAPLCKSTREVYALKYTTRQAIRWPHRNFDVTYINLSHFSSVELNKSILA